MGTVSEKRPRRITSVGEKAVAERRELTRRLEMLAERRGLKQRLHRINEALSDDETPGDEACVRWVSVRPGKLARMMALLISCLPHVPRSLAEEIRTAMRDGLS